MKRILSSIVLLSLFLSILSLFGSCKTRSENQLVGVSITLKSLCENPHKYLNTEIDLAGTFLGWSGQNCNFVKNFAHQLKRSDWTFTDSEQNCIYVTGGKPDFLEPFNKEDLGVKIQLKAKLMQNKDKKFYLLYISSYKDAGNN